jgi:hypothetical protein
MVMSTPLHTIKRALRSFHDGKKLVTINRAETAIQSKDTDPRGTKVVSGR